MFEDFLKEKQYITNVSPRTLEWYSLALRYLHKEDPDERELKNVVIRMREAGIKPRSVNSYRTAINSYLSWAGIDLSIPRMKDEQKILPTFKPEDIQTVLKWKPKTRCQRRIHTLTLALVDTGCRISELLGLTWPDVDFDNLLVKVRGKGGKFRIIPFSLELRKHLFKLQKESKFERVFSTKDGNELMRRNMNRDVKALCKKLNIRIPERSLHALRHTFAVNYLRRGGSVFHLQKALGHASLDMTRRYANLMTEDLQKVHQQITLLG